MFNNFELQQPHNQKFSKLNRDEIAWRYLLKSQKYWDCKVLLGIITTTMTQLNSLFCVALLIFLV